MEFILGISLTLNLIFIIIGIIIYKKVLSNSYLGLMNIKPKKEDNKYESEFPWKL